MLAAFVLGAAFMFFLQFGGMAFGPAFVTDTSDVQAHWEPAIYRDYARYEETILTSLLEKVDYRETDNPEMLEKEISKLGDVAEAVAIERMARDGPAPIAEFMSPSKVSGEAVPEQDL